MEVFYASLVLLLFADVGVALFLAIYAFQRREVPGVRAFFWFMVLICGWTLTSAVATLTGSEAVSAIIEGQLRYLFVATLPVALLAFAMDYTGRNHWLTAERIGGLLAIPLITQFVVWFAPQHFLDDVTFQQVGPFLIRDDYSPSGWFWVHTAYSYGLSVWAFALIGQYALQARETLRQQATVLFASMMMPFVGNVWMTFFPLDQPIPDLTVLLFSLTGILWGWALFRFQLLDLMPVARYAAVEGMDDAVLVLDTRWRVADLNPAAQALVGLQSAEVIGKVVDDVMDWGEALSDHSDSMSERRTEVTLDGVVFELRVSPLVRRGYPVGGLMVLRDITERVQAEHEREVLIGDLRGFAHTVAHDLKNPLATIMSRAELLGIQMEGLSPEERQAAIERMVNTADKMGSIINALLLMAEVRQTLPDSVGPMDMQRIVQEVRDRLADQEAQSGAEIKTQPHWPQARGFAPWVEEVWVNYLTNALKYGGAPPTLELGGAVTPEGYARYWVLDHGPGLTAEQQGALFVPFSRASQHSPTSHGLGLSIVKSIVERLDGRVGVESTPGEGSRFWFELPATSATDP